jgi:hypothetical protein
VRREPHISALTPKLTAVEELNGKLEFKSMAYVHPWEGESSSKIAGKEISLSYHNCTLSLYVDPHVGIGGDKWPAAELFCLFVTSSRWRLAFSLIFAGKSCLELGSGNVS